MKKIILVISLIFLCLNSFGQIVANDDLIQPVNGLTGNSNPGNILQPNGNGSDLLNGNAVLLSEINITIVVPATPINAASVPTINAATGIVSVPAGTPAGTYVITYQICEIANPNNCDTAIVTIPVSAAPINAVDDVLNITNYANNTYSVIANDSFNGVPLNSSAVIITLISSDSNIGLSSNGTLLFPSLAPPGSGVFTIVYQICEVLNPTNCDVAVVTINDNNNPLFTLTNDGFYQDTTLPAFVSVGDVINYNYVITNNTTETITNIFITDVNATVTGNPITLTPGQSNSTAYSAEHIITQQDIDVGQVDNLATVTGTRTNGLNVTAMSTDPTPCATCNSIISSCLNCTMVPLSQNPAVQLTMDGNFSDLNSNGYADVGENIIYNFLVVNTGNVTLTNIFVSSQSFTVNGGPINSIAVGAADSTTFVGIYTITQADIDAGQIDAFAAILAISLGGSAIIDYSTDPTPCSSCTPLSPNCLNCTIVEITNQPIHSIAIDATYSDYNNDGFTNVGDVINYQYTLVNANSDNPITNITVSGSNVIVSGGTLASLAPNSTNNTTFNAVYVLTQADINSGLVTTTVIANGFLTTNSVNASASLTFNLNISSGIKLNAFIDNNLNGIQDGSEQNISISQGSFYYQINNGENHSLTSSNGMVILYEGNPLNTYNIGFTINPAYASQYTVTTSSYSNVTVATNSGITTYNFPLEQIPFVDLKVNLYNYGASPRPGFQYSNYIQYINNGNLPIASGTVTFTNSNVVTVTSTNPATTITPTGFTYNFVNLLPGEIRSIIVNMQVPTIPTVSLGQLVTNNVTISTPSGDINVANNTSTLTQTIVGSYDPNDKQESHGGKILHSSFTANDYLTYTIRFENTGTAEAVNIRVEDVLDAQLDETSVRMVAASNPYVLDRVGSNLTWRFDGVNLPPSSPASETIGHGYIVFQVKPNAGYAIGDIIPNYADIYFDFNPAIVTNVCNTEFVATLSNTNFAFTNLNYYPNPVKNNLSISNNSIIDSVEITSVLGQQMINQKVNSLQTELDLSELSRGIYFVKISSQNHEKTFKIVKE